LNLSQSHYKLTTTITVLTLPTIIPPRQPSRA
jgi:hypothetical protein